MKVLHVTFSDNFGGANIAALRLHEALESKINSKLIVFNKRKNKKNILQFKDSTFFNIKLKNYIAKIILLFFSKTNNHSLNIFNSKLLNVINDSDADIIHLHWINNELLSIQDISKIKKKIVWTAHDMWPFSGSEHYTKNNRFINGYSFKNKNFFGIDIPYYIWCLKKTYFKNNINFIAPSLWMKKKIKKSYLFKHNKVSVLRNPINTKIWKNRNIIKDKNKLIFAVCALNVMHDQRKGFANLIQSLNKLNLNTKFELYVIGDNKAFEIKTNFKVVNLGYINGQINLSKVYNNCDALIIPSEADNFPNVGIEAMASGLPIISLKNNGINEIIKHGHNGMTLKKFDNESLTKVMKWVLKTKNRKNYNLNLSKSVKKMLGYKTISKQVINLYKKIIYEKN
jgi:glycosyltransferase involved in cell wall biosynthesis